MIFFRLESLKADKHLSHSSLIAYGRSVLHPGSRFYFAERMVLPDGKANREAAAIC